MDITNFLESTYDAHQQYDYRVLIYGNYTDIENLERDSFVQVLKPVLTNMDDRHKIHYTLLTPSTIKSLNKPNVKQVIYKLPTYPNLMRTHFDATEFLKVIDWRHNDYDIIYSHLPEHTSQIANVIHNSTHLMPKIIGYCHWFEVAENAPYAKTMFLNNILGILEMEECGVNSKWLKNFVIEYAKEHFNDNVIAQLDKIIQPHYLGVDRSEVRDVSNIIPKSVIFNHRANDYTGWNWFVKAMDDLWQKRQDFTVYTTYAKIDRPWNKQIDEPTREGYMAQMQRMQFGVACFEGYSAWSISTTDGLSMNVPYLLPKKLCYPEMVPADYPYFYKNRAEFVEKFEEMLDNPLTYNTKELSYNMLWGIRIDQWFDKWDKVFTFKKMLNSKAIDNIIDIIHTRKYISKYDLLNELGWGVQIKWSPYRNTLREHPNIKLTADGYEWKD
jgi:hypothetical protein